MLIKLMDNKLKEFKNNIMTIYKNLPELFNYLDDMSYIKFLYSHMNEIDVVITKNILKGEHIICTKLKVNENFTTNTTLIYRKYLSEMEKNIINSGEFYVTIVEKTYPKIEEGALKTDVDKFFELKNRRDFLVPMFFHKLTIDTFSKFKINDIENYKERNKRFFKLLIYLRKYVRTVERLGVMLDSSITLNLHNVRKNNDLDLVILHPRFDHPEIKKNLKENIAKRFDFVDAYMPNIHIDWIQKTKELLDENSKEFSDNKLQSFNEVVFSPNYHYYFFGIKVISLEYDLKYRAKRRFPKNVADLIIAKDKLKINVPKIKKLEPVINVLENTYDTDKFVKVVSNYLKRFDHNADNVEERIKELY